MLWHKCAYLNCAFDKRITPTLLFVRRKVSFFCSVSFVCYYYSHFDCLICSNRTTWSVRSVFFIIFIRPSMLFVASSAFDCVCVCVFMGEREEEAKCTHCTCNLRSIGSVILSFSSFWMRDSFCIASLSRYFYCFFTSLCVSSIVNQEIFCDCFGLNPH